MTGRAGSVTHVEHCMGTVFSFRIGSSAVADAVLGTILARLHAVDATFSTYRPDSEISRLDAGDLTLEAASPEVRHVLAECARFERLTHGFFSARPDGRALDPSGYVKGWAIQEAADTLGRAGSLTHCVNGGGDVVCAGSPEGRPAWRIGVADPHDPGRLLDTIEMAGPVAVATSGTAERGAHVLDPHTGRPATGLASVTVAAPDLITADVYATAALAMGPERARAWLTDQGSTQPLRAILVDARGVRHDVHPRQPAAGQRGARART